MKEDYILVMFQHLFLDVSASRNFQGLKRNKIKQQYVDLLWWSELF